MFEWLKKYFRREKINADLVKEVLVVNDRLMELSKIMDEYYELLYEFNKETLPGNEYYFINTPTACLRVEDIVVNHKKSIFKAYKEANDAAFNYDDNYCEKISILNNLINNFKKGIDLIKVELDYISDIEILLNNAEEEINDFIVLEEYEQPFANRIPGDLLEYLALLRATNIHKRLCGKVVYDNDRIVIYQDGKCIGRTHVLSYYARDKLIDLINGANKYINILDGGVDD